MKGICAKNLPPLSSIALFNVSKLPSREIASVINLAPLASSSVVLAVTSARSSKFFSPKIVSLSPTTL